MRIVLGTLVALIVVAVGFSRPAVVQALPTPIPHPSQTPPPDLAQPSPTALPLLINGQIVDVELGFIVFSSGDAFRLAPASAFVDDATGLKPHYEIGPGVFAVAALDPATAQVTRVRTSLHPLAQGTPAAQIPRQYVVEASSPQPNPDLAPPTGIYSSRLSTKTQVAFTVQVPPDTPFTDSVYMATDTSGWNPQAIKLQRVDGLHFRTLIELPGGTAFSYLFTRGSWQNVERDQAGLERKARRIFVTGADSQIVYAQVYRWADLP